MTPNDVKVKRNTTALAVASAGRSDGKRHRTERTPPAGTEHSGGFFLVRVEMRPKATDRPHHDGVVEEHVGDQNRPDGLVESEIAERTAGAEERRERGAHDHGRQHERHGDERAHDAASGKLVARQHVGAGQCDRHGKDRRQCRLPHREPDHVPERGIVDDFAEGVEVERAVRHETATHDRDDRVCKEHREECDGDDREQRGRDARPRHECYRSTVLVHCSIH